MYINLIKALDREGILSVPGETDKIKEIKCSFEQGMENIDLNRYGAHDITGALISYLFELPEPILTRSSYVKFISAQCKY